MGYGRGPRSDGLQPQAQSIELQYTAKQQPCPSTVGFTSFKPKKSRPSLSKTELLHHLHGQPISSQPRTTETPLRNTPSGLLRAHALDELPTQQLT